MKRIGLLLSLFCALMLAGAGTVAAQTPEVDIDSASESVLAIDPQDLVDALAEAPDDSVLPEGFMNPASGTPEAADLIDAFATPISDMDGAVGTVTHGLDTDSDVVPGLLSAGIITYIVTDEEITEDDMEDFAEGASGGMDGAGQEGLDSSVDVTELAGTTAVQITVTTEASGVIAVVQIYAIPVGNTMVIGTVVSADQDAVDEDAVADLTEQLTLAGVENIALVAEDAA